MPKPINLTEIDFSGFWSRVQMRGENDCWEWTGGQTVPGYGLYRGFYTHRLMASIMKGGDVGDVEVCHKCDNPPCCNPSHLFVGTRQDNCLDAWAKGRLSASLALAWKTRRGENNSRTKLTASNVREIKHRYRNGESAINIAKGFPCGATAIGNIVKGRNWAHIKI